MVQCQLYGYPIYYGVFLDDVLAVSGMFLSENQLSAGC